MPITDRFRKAMAAKGRKAVVKTITRTYPRTSIPRSLPTRQVQAVVQRAMARASEQKYVDMPFVLTSTNLLKTFTTNGQIFILNGIQQGAGQNNRVGNKVMLQSLKLELAFTHTYNQALANNALVGNKVRIVTFWDKEGGVTPNWNQIFGEIYQDGTSGTTLQSGVVPYNKSRFIILDDAVIDMPIATYNFTVAGPTNTTTTPLPQSQQYTYRKFINLAKKNMQSIFAGTSSPITYANFSSGILYCAIRAFDAAAPFDNVVDLLELYGSRVRYTDV